MKIILSSRRHHYVKIVGIFLIAATLIAGMVGCVPTQYNLTISSTEGGEVTTPGEGTFIYFAGTVVGLVAEAEEDYRFVNWTGNVSAIADVNADATTITMNGDYSITANFAIAIEIWDWYDLDAISNNLSGSYILMNDLDSTTPGYEELASPTANLGKGWQPIGTVDNRFTGTFDGQGYEISDLFINRADESGIGLFGFVGSGGGVIKDIGVVNATVTGGTYGVGGLVGGNLGTVSNSYSTGNVTGEWYVGGLVGSNEEGSTVSNSYSTGSVTGRLGGGHVGGLVGRNGDTVSNSYSSASVTGDYIVGGLVGENGDTVSNSYSIGSVAGEMHVGGLVGSNGYILSNSYSTGNVTGNLNVGGLVGWNYDGATVSDSYSTGSVTGNSSVGGLVGQNDWNVSDSFWDTETSGQATSDGGTGKTTVEMKDINTFTGWNIIAVSAANQRDASKIWNIVTATTYPFLSWEPVS